MYWLPLIKNCTICNDLFRVRKNAKTSETRQLCAKCRKTLKRKNTGLEITVLGGCVESVLLNGVAVEYTLNDLDVNN